MKRDRNCGGMMPYPIYPPYQGMAQPPMPVPYGNMNNFSTQSNSNEISNLEQQVNNLENRVNNLENMLNNSNSILNSNTKYNSSNYQMM